MRPVLILLFTLIPVCLLFGHPFPDPQQEYGNRMAIIADSEDLQRMDSETLARFSGLGITLLEIEGDLPTGFASIAADHGFTILLRNDRSWTTVPELRENFETWLAEDLEWIERSKRELNGNNSAFGIFRMPAVNRPGMTPLLGNYVSRLREQIEDPLLLYFISAFTDLHSPPTGFDFISVSPPLLHPPPEAMPAVHFRPGAASLEHAPLFRVLLEQSLELEQSLLFVDSDWLLEMLNLYEPFETVIRSYSEGGELLFPMPHLPDQSPKPDWLVILLLAVGATGLIHYRYSPSYQRSLFRYFTMHRFFVDDVMEYRLRSLATGLILVAQNAFVCAVFTFMTAWWLFSENGLEILQYHFPLLSLFGTGPFSLFLWGLAAAIIMQFISVLWIHLPNRRIRSIAQTLQLYGWPLQLNVLVLALMISIYKAGGADGWLHTLGILFLLIWFSGFNIAAIDSGRYLPKHRIPYILATVGLHFLLMGGFILWLFITPEIREVLLFAVAVP
ncbi:MAG: hypothetical protein WDZ29_07595 [Balneolaceae bacterium]